jgi:uncharacterized membrane protein YuzA (DUF378 family)
LRHAKPKRGNGLSRIFAMPMILVGITAFGLLAALLGDGIWDGLSWLAMAIPLAAIAYHAMKA